MSLAVCITGQVSRMEWKSKLENVVKPNVATWPRMGIFMVLSNTNVNYVNPYKHPIVSPECPPSGCLSTVRSDVPPGIVVRETIFKERDYITDMEWAKRMDKFDPVTNLKRQNMHLSQWSKLRVCMQLVEDVELKEHFTYEVVVKLREDSMALMPFHIPREWSDKGIVTLNCNMWGGLMDGFYVLGRKWASKVMEGLSVDWYFEHDIPNKNPETWLLRIVNKHKIPKLFVDRCVMPFVPVIPVNFSRRITFRVNHATYTTITKCKNRCNFTQIVKRMGSVIPVRGRVDLVSV